MIRCSECGAEAPALKTVYWIEDEEGWEYALCDECYADVAGEVMVVAGALPCWGTCRVCREWFSVRDLSERTGGGRWDSPTGLCAGCAVGSGAPVR